MLGGDLITKRPRESELGAFLDKPFLYESPLGIVFMNDPCSRMLFSIPHFRFCGFVPVIEGGNNSATFCQAVALFRRAENYIDANPNLLQAWPSGNGSN